jgi:hypothetical protein
MRSARPLSRSYGFAQANRNKRVITAGWPVCVLRGPRLNADTAQQLTGTTYAALNGLTDAGVLEVLSQNKRNRIWAATDVLAELDALSAAIGRRSTHPQA